MVTAIAIASGLSVNSTDEDNLATDALPSPTHAYLDDHKCQHPGYHQARLLAHACCTASGHDDNRESNEVPAGANLLMGPESLAHPEQ